VPPSQPIGPLQVHVEFDSGPLAGVLKASAKVDIVKGQSP
jgi:hypothetical protein